MTFRISTLVGILLTCLNAEVAADTSWWQRGLDLIHGSGSPSSVSASLSEDEIGKGLREALRVGTETVVGKLGRTDGFNLDPAVHIPLPKTLKDVQKTLAKVGMASKLDELEARLNRAAETATPKAKQLFFDAIEEMTIDDIRAIYEGSDDSATRYFEQKMSAPLADEMSPIVADSLAQVGAVKSYDKIMDKYHSIPFVPDVKSDLTDYVVDRGIEGIFHYLAQEEAAIRRDPVKRTTDLLQRVFGASRD